MFEVIVKRVLAIELLLVFLESAFTIQRTWLPIGGSHLAQIGACFVLAYAYYELAPRSDRSQDRRDDL